MNVKIIGSVVRWILITSGVITTFMNDASFIEAFNKLKEAMSSGNKVAIITHAGGPAVMLTDAISSNGIKIPHFSGNSFKDFGM